MVDYVDLGPAWVFRQLMLLFMFSRSCFNLRSSRVYFVIYSRVAV